MAQVHPSRAAFVPQSDAKPGFSGNHSRDRDYAGKSRGRSRSRSPPRRRSLSPNRPKDRSRERRKGYSPERRDAKRSEGERHDRSRSPTRRTQRSRSRDGRNSPSYEAYRQRKASGEQDTGLSAQPQNNWQRNYQQGSGYSGGGYTAGPPRGYTGNIGGGDAFFEERRRRRDTMTLNVWPPSPKEPSRSLSPDGRRHRDKHTSKNKGDRGKGRDKRREKSDSKKKRKRSRSPSSSETDSSEEERRREKRSRRHKERDDRRSRSREHSSSRRRSMSRRHSSPSPPPREHAEATSTEIEAESLWIEKTPVTSAMPPPPVPAAVAALPNVADANEDDEEIGPMPPQRIRDRIDEREYGGALLRGEGSAMAAFLQDNSRIPRRGEIGLTSDEIASYEDVGYVMSGSRHRKMNAVRMRKENQVISAEEKRSILKLQKEERERREELLKAEFRELVEEQLGSIGAARK